MQLGRFLSFSGGTHDHAEVMRLDGFHDLLQAFPFFRGVDLFGDRHHVVEGGDHDKAARQGDFAAQAGPFRGDGLFEDLYEDIGFAAQHFGDLACFDDLRFVLELGEVERFGLVGDGLLGGT